MKKQIITMIVIVIVIGAGAFYGGMQYGKSKTSANGPADFGNLTPEQRQARVQQFGGANGDRNRNGSGFTSGEIIAKDDKSITVKLPDGGSKIIFLADKTEISKFASGALSDLEIGKNVSINGTANSDGSITAQTIQLRPAMPPVVANTNTNTSASK
ncbi:MAG: hypothetical protein V1684_02870 [bacterium]